MCWAAATRARHPAQAHTDADFTAVIGFSNADNTSLRAKLRPRPACRFEQHRDGIIGRPHLCGGCRKHRHGCKLARIAMPFGDSESNSTSNSIDFGMGNHEIIVKANEVDSCHIASGNCLQTSTNGKIVSSGGACGVASGGTAFSSVTSGNNTAATMTVGAGGISTGTGQYGNHHRQQSDARRQCWNSYAVVSCAVPSAMRARPAAQEVAFHRSPEMEPC